MQFTCWLYGHRSKFILPRQLPFLFHLNCNRRRLDRETAQTPTTSQPFSLSKFSIKNKIAWNRFEATVKEWINLHLITPIITRETLRKRKRKFHCKYFVWLCLRAERVDFAFGEKERISLTHSRKIKEILSNGRVKWINDLQAKKVFDFFQNEKKTKTENFSLKENHLERQHLCLGRRT